MRDNENILLIGMANTGKSTVVLDYLYQHKDIPVVTVISPTEKYEKIYCRHVPSMLINSEYYPESIKNLHERQSLLTREIRNNPNYKEVDPRLTIVFDACECYLSELLKDNNTRSIMNNNRHLSCASIFTIQSIFGISPEFRNSFKYVFLCGNTDSAQKTVLYETYGNVFGTFDEFKRVYDKYTQNYGVLVINRTNGSNNLEECVFWYKTEPELIADWNNFRLCREELWNTDTKEV